MTVPQLAASEEALRWDRLVDAYEEGQLTPAEIQRTRARLDARTIARQRGKLRLVLVAGLQGFAIGLVTLGAGAWVTEKVWLSETHVTASAPGEQAKAAPAATPRRATAVAAPAAAPPLAEPPTAAFEGATEPAAGSGALAAPPADARTLIAELPPEDGPWKRVAAALAANDLPRADWELSGLVKSSDPATRDAAELARAQLAISAGRGGATLATLTRLASAGHTPLIRKRAAELLGTMGGR